MQTDRRTLLKGCVGAIITPALAATARASLAAAPPAVVAPKANGLVVLFAQYKGEGLREAAVCVAANDIIDLRHVHGCFRFELPQGFEAWLSAAVNWCAAGPIMESPYRLTDGPGLYELRPVLTDGHLRQLLVSGPNRKMVVPNPGYMQFREGA